MNFPKFEIQWSPDFKQITVSSISDFGGFSMQIEASWRPTI